MKTIHSKLFKGIVSQILSTSFAIFVLMTLFMIYPAQAEYRAYQFLLQHKSGKEEIITSHLPLSSFKYYYPPGQTKIEYLRTWICPGNTANKKTCESPYNAASTQPKAIP